MQKKCKNLLSYGQNLSSNQWRKIILIAYEIWSHYVIKISDRVNIVWNKAIFKIQNHFVNILLFQHWSRSGMKIDLNIQDILSVFVL